VGVPSGASQCEAFGHKLLTFAHASPGGGVSGTQAGLPSGASQCEVLGQRIFTFAHASWEPEGAEPEEPEVERSEAEEPAPFSTADEHAVAAPVKRRRRAADEVRRQGLVFMMALDFLEDAGG
jgi:hypothetical protein